MQPTINSTKHYVPRGNTSISSGAVNSFEPVQGKALSAVSAATDIRAGAIVKAIYLEMWLLSAGISGTVTQFTMTLEKLPSGGTPMTFAQSTNLMDYPNKKNIFYHTQGILSGEDTTSIPIIRQWFKIPKGKQRFGKDDNMVLTTGSTGQAIGICGFAVYKEYY